MRENISFYKNLIKKHGYKFTMQKRIILLEVINSNTHLSVKEIYDRVKHNRIGITTVYRSLKTFNELGIVKEINVNGTSYYEIKIFSGNPLHIHFKCSKCNSIIDIEDNFLNLEYIKLNKKIEEKNNLEIDDLNIMLIGTCSKCKEDMNG
ncbi:transcriptional repressor [Clostridium botulinum]|uniref:Fur family transcriptional regulator n=1 Tax=Clostridium botulinum TaxID=1491 RepID=UPI00077495EE|nr:transcriptional repressor [Clostridium botulinum]NFH81950.1 transcriptional repressor [Clostridium botulinum]NFI09924.1 transcriptional repressor [Clostridium botulinum]NFI15081.1 transcriptional repressor [Clostridium botulinum]NFO84763.1 transcriptional repressor [Clostridium botulinum]